MTHSLSPKIFRKSRVDIHFGDCYKSNDANRKNITVLAKSMEIGQPGPYLRTHENIEIISSSIVT